MATDLEDYAVQCHGIAGLFNRPHFHKGELLIVVYIHVNDSVAWPKKKIRPFGRDFDKIMHSMEIWITLI